MNFAPRRWVWCVALLLPVAPTAQAGVDCSLLDLEGVPLDRALLRFAQHAGTSVLFQQEQVRERRAGGGLLPADCDRALDALLLDSGLVVERVGEGILVVRSAPASVSSAVPEVVLPPTATRVPMPPVAVEEVRVVGRSLTGSRLRHAAYDAPAQIDIIDRQEIEASGLQTLTELLRFLPAVAGNATSTYVTNGGDGTATVTLRGLPASHTLVLLNGRRFTSDALKGHAVNLNAIPLAAIEQIEVLKDGASAIHGSDAIAGVINVITREGLQGLHASSYAGQSSRGDLDTYHHSLVWGAGDEVASYAIGVDRYEQRPIFSRDRRVSRSSDDRDRGGVDNRSSAIAPARITSPFGPVTLADGATGTSTLDFVPVTGEDRFEYRDQTSAIVPLDRTSVFAWGSSELPLQTQGWFEVMYTQTDALSTLAPAPLFTGFEAIDLAVAADAAFNPFGVELGDVRRRFVEVGNRGQRNRTDTYHIVTGLTFQAFGANVDVVLTHDQARGEERVTGVLDGTRLQAALGPEADCAADAECVPLNLFGPVGSITPEMLDYVVTESDARGRARLTSLSMNADLTLAEISAGRVEFAMGAEVRREELRVNADPRSEAGLLVAGGSFGGVRGMREVKEVYAELVAPLVAPRPGVELLELHFADRYSEYSDFGATHNPRVALRYRPHRDLLVRASWGGGFRAPSLREVHLSVQQSAAFITDPCAADDAVARLPGCILQSDPTLNQFLSLTTGNRDLEAEQSRTFTAGLAWTPSQVPGDLRLSADLYAIEQEDVIDTSAQFIVDENAATGAFGTLVVRDALGNLQQVSATSLNVGKRRISGVDLSANWILPPMAAGWFELLVNASHIREFVTQVNPGAPVEDRAGTFQDAAAEGLGALPEWKATFGVTWAHGPWSARYDLHHVSSLREEVPRTTRIRTIQQWTVQDVQLSYRWVDPADVRVTLGVNNLFDEAAPFSAAAFNDSFDSRTHDLIGRFLYTRLTAQL